MNRILQLSFITAALCCQTLAAQAATVFIEEAGVVVVEIENAATVSGWHKSTDFSDYRGSGHYEWTGPANMNVKKAGDGILSYHFTIQNAGNYEFRWRSQIGEGNNKTESNDSWVRFPTGRNIDGEYTLNGWTKAYMNKLGEWTWITKTVDHVGKPLRQYFSAGDHTVEISGRSTGHVIDRFALYKYDSVTFDSVRFDHASESQSTGKTVVTAPPAAEPEPDNNTDSTTTLTTASGNAKPVSVSPTSQWMVPADQAPANECSSNKISLQPTIDIYVDSNRIISSGNLRISDTTRKSFLKFDLSAIPATMTSALLTWTVGVDSGEGTIVVSAGSHSNWTENNAQLLPDISYQIGSFAGTWDDNTRYGLPLDQALLANEPTTLILDMLQGADDVSMVPSGNDQDVRLELTGSSGFCDEFAAITLESAAITNTSEIAGALASQPISTDQIAAEPTAGAANGEENEATEGGGAWGLLEHLLITTTLLGYLSRRRRLHHQGARTARK